MKLCKVSIKYLLPSKIILKLLSDHTEVLPPVDKLVLIGDGICNMDVNNLFYFFDGGDCCEENVTNFELFSDNLDLKPNPKSTCIPSLGYSYCIEAQLGDGKCQDYNNSPLCQFDFGDCCNAASESCCNRECAFCGCKDPGAMPCSWPPGYQGVCN